MRRSRARLAGVALLLGAGLGLAGCFNFEVTKEVTGGTSQGPFEVEIECPSSVIGTSETLAFNGPGTETTMEFASDEPATCTITETETAGASGVSLACTLPVPPGVTCNSVPNGLVVAGIDGGLGEPVTIGITVVNDFTPAPTAPPGDPGTPPPADPGAPAAPVVGTPRFTG